MRLTMWIKMEDMALLKVMRIFTKEILSIVNTIYVQKELKMDIYDICGILLYKNVDIKDLEYANLKSANLEDADLEYANFKGTNLEGANLKNAYFKDANLQNADLKGANLEDVYLEYSNLKGANLEGANLKGTCLDPNNFPNMRADGFKMFKSRSDMTWCVGYRTINSMYINSNSYYEVGKLYEAPWFSTDEGTECHPGLYVEPYNESNIFGLTKIKVIFPDYVLHRAGNKHRVKWFIVVEEMPV